MEANSLLLQAFETEVGAAMAVPDADPAFLANLRRQVTAQGAKDQPQSSQRRWLGLRPTWAILLIIVIVLGGVLLVIGPQQVYARITQWLGYIPGVGMVDQSAPIRVLAEPVSLTRDGITITVTSVTLSADRTRVDYEVSGVPRSAYPDREDVHGCWAERYLRLPDGTELTPTNHGYEPVPAEMDEAIFVLSCIPSTLPGTVPVNWEFPLQFIPAPEDLAVFPVVERTLTPQADSTSETVPTLESELTPDTPRQGTVAVHKEITTQEGYILIGQFQPEDLNGRIDPQNLGWIMTRPLEIQDANGVSVTYTFPRDVIPEVNQAPNGTGWAAEFNAAGLAFPLTLSYSGVEILPAGNPDDSAEFTIDVGPDPQPGQTWELNRKLTLSGHTLMLTSVTADSRGGYDFDFSATDLAIYQASVQIVGQIPNGGGGGGGGGLTDGTFKVNLSYTTLPTGVLTIQVSNLMLIGDPVLWQGQWSPATP